VLHGHTGGAGAGGWEREESWRGESTVRAEEKDQRRLNGTLVLRDQDGPIDSPQLEADSRVRACRGL
jgi:hypothetical protein